MPVKVFSLVPAALKIRWAVQQGCCLPARVPAARIRCRLLLLLVSSLRSKMMGTNTQLYFYPSISALSPFIRRYWFARQPPCCHWLERSLAFLYQRACRIGTLPRVIITPHVRGLLGVSVLSSYHSRKQTRRICFYLDTTAGPVPTPCVFFFKMSEVMRVSLQQTQPPRQDVPL